MADSPCMKNRSLKAGGRLTGGRLRQVLLYILEKRRLGNDDADSTRASESRRSHPVEFYWSQTSSTANARAHRSTFGA